MRLRLARRPWARARGLLGARSLDQDEGLWIEPCSWIHTFGMRFPLDLLLLYLDGEGRILQLAEAMRRKARAVVELAPGRIAASDLQVGERVEIRHD